jgi:hypothetical protein
MGFEVQQAPRRQRVDGFRVAMVSLSAVLMFGCGGGGGSTPSSVANTPEPATTPASTLAPMVDAFGTVLKEDDFGKGDAAAAGLSGTAANGAPIANAIVQVIDNAGHKVTGRTDANGTYRLRIDGFVPPLIASVVKPDGTSWYSPSLASPVVRGFINISISGLSDFVAAKVAEAANLGSSAQLTPAILLSNSAALAAAKKTLTAQVLTQLQEAGVDPATFDPVLTVFVANGKGYDAVLDRVLVTNSAVTTTSIVPLKSISGTVDWPGAVVCVTTVTTVGITPCSLTLGLRSEQLPVKYPSGIFEFKTRLPSKANYSVSVIGVSLDLSARGGCALANSQGVVGETDVKNVGVFCR